MFEAPDTVTDGDTVFMFYREHFPEGKFAGYKSADSRFRFILDGQTFTPNGLADYLTREYEQVHEDGIRAAMSGYSAIRSLAE